MKNNKLNEEEMKKKVLTAALAFALSAGICGTVSAAEVTLRIGDTAITVNGEEQTIDTAPVIIDSRTFVPVRAVVEALGGTADWNANTKTAILENGEDHIELTIGSKTAVLNGEEKQLDTAPVIIDGRTMLPLRFIAEGFGFEADWDAAAKTIYVSKTDAEETTAENKSENKRVVPEHERFTDTEGCETFEQVTEKLKDGQGYANVTIGSTKALLAADIVSDFEGSHNAVEAEIFMIEDGAVKYLGCAASTGSGTPVAFSDGMIYTAGHHFVSKQTISNGALVTVEEAWETFDEDGNVTYHSADFSGEQAEKIFEKLTDEYYNAEPFEFEIIGADKAGTAGSNIPLKDNAEEAEKQIKAAMLKLIEEIYGDSIVDARINVTKIYTAEEEQEFDALKQRKLGENEVAFELGYELKPAEDADIFSLTVPDGVYDEKTGWVTEIHRLGILCPDGDGYTITDFGTGW